MEERQYLKESILLYGESDSGKFKRNFGIGEILGEGASSICYEAYHSGSSRGVLKEFYPKTDYDLERDTSGQPFRSAEFGDANEKFEKAKQEYLEPYNLLLNVKKNSMDHEVATFIPAFEIYHNCDSEFNRNGTVYIWTPEPKLDTFDKICEEIHKHSRNNPEHKLVTVLRAIESLTKCVCVLHRTDIIHRDIKPSNFGFKKRGNEPLIETLTMFDINSLCSVFAKLDEGMGTPGYVEPEASYEDANNQTDIYSIGATLFHAIIVSDETKAGNYLYRQEYYERLQELVDGSELIQASEANSHPRLRNKIKVILQKCLCERIGRYANCEELLADLKDALFYALPSDYAKMRHSGIELVLKDIEKSLDINKEKNSTLAIQYHLFKKPLYHCVSEDETTINVIVVGFGNYGQKFLDVCLQVGQIREKTINVTVISEDSTDKKIYLSERPELAEFFNIDGSLEKCNDTYGNITFEISKLARDDQKANGDILEKKMRVQCDQKRPHYIFIALGEDELNAAAAKSCKQAVDELKMPCIVNYVREDTRSTKDKDEDPNPVNVNAEIKKSDLYPEIERMAFNTHLVWEKNLNIDYRGVKEEFRKKYNHDSCVSSVLSLKYKLYSIGIDLEQRNFDEAAQLYMCGLKTSKEKREIKNELIWIEHRRWVTEKLCLGWRRISNLEDCLGGVTKDKKRKRHVCILRSRPDQKLAVEYSMNGNYQKWDKESESDLDQLDELDRMSVELHRVFAKKAEETKKLNLLNGNTMASIRTLIKNNKKAVLAFQEWFTCLKDIWNGDREKVRLYKGLKESFLNATEGQEENSRNAVRDQVRAFESIFYPILASMEYRDWKQDDVAFIENIPFVLTYSENVCLVIPYATGDNTAVFGNVATPTVVNPKRILYLYLIKNNKDISELRKSLPYVAEYMRKKKLMAEVEFIVAYPNTLKSVIGIDFDRELSRLSNGRIRETKIKHVQLKHIDDLATDLENCLKKKRRDKKLFAIERNNTTISNILQGAGVYKSFANYQFDSGSMKFDVLFGCDMFGYIRKSPYLTVTDMAAIRRSSSKGSNQPEFFYDYKDLWKKYRENSSLWKLLCNVLEEHSKKKDIIASFRKNQKIKDGNEQEYRYIIPVNCNIGAEKIINYLKMQGIAEQGSRVNGYTTDSCEVIVIDRCGYSAEYDRLFSIVYALMFHDAITLHLNTKSHVVNVVFDNLIVSNIQISGNKSVELSGLMNYFREKGYVINLKISSDEKMSFTYATNQIKKLLTTAGKILEVYTYHKVKELGFFDEVVSSFEIEWEEGTEVKSEVDCILTKGFSVLFLECKTSQNLEQDYYYKLAKMAEELGINATAVMIADTQEKSYFDTASVNAMQRKRGGMMNVVTVWKPNEISNIGHTLLKVVNGTYMSEEECVNV